MLFNSIQFLFFFVVVTLAYYRLGWNGRWLLLLLASCYFYLVFKPVFILILFLTIVIDYVAGIWIEQSEGRKRWWLLVISIISNVGILAFFKYFDFAVENLNKVFFNLNLGIGLPHLNGLLPPQIAEYMSEAGRVILPIGLSFHTFQAMSYTIEVYRKNQKAERHFGIYALYVMFYPQLVAGPIERPQNVLPQFHEYFAYDWENVKAGLMRMAFGFFKKAVIADRLALMAGPAYEQPGEHNGLTLLVATFFYTFRIYCDFSGYSDIALGAAQAMGFKLMENFKTPYISRSIAEFWNRWHISLSTWFRDYLYISMGGNRRGEARAYFNRITVFLVSGLWHGASWNFVIWGGLHGFYLIGASLRDKWQKKLNIQMPSAAWYGWLQGLLTFGLVMLTWVFFAVGGQSDGGSVQESVLILKKIARLSFSDPIQSALKPAEMWFCVLLIAILMLKEHFYFYISTRRNWSFFALFIFLAVVCYFFGVYNSKQFIYFQF
ncbi:MAG: MBOAT family protein [Cytophagia bacterium]|nr:MAG: MBOAT family protein [Runella sp.]TAG19786.1 MAG: MBOAT family protein [Cytophagales bacterium]TAG39419.1 MAG: MBOAT family protein [Cytophagia bacterium]TAG51797.1 MAG: MBOAT family protein [Runella slithyformis]TAG80606.1 MAG: MBOAT family protein [Cytophagales bacterium]